MCLAVPKAPGTPSIVNVTKDSVTIEWDHPVFDGGSEIYGYYIEKKESNSILWQRANETLVNTTGYTIKGNLNIKLMLVILLIN